MPGILPRANCRCQMGPEPRPWRARSAGATSQGLTRTPLTMIISWWVGVKAGGSWFQGGWNSDQGQVSRVARYQDRTSLQMGMGLGRARRRFRAWLAQARLPGELVRCRPGVVAAPCTLRRRVLGRGSGRLSMMRFITIVEVMRWTPGKVASLWSRSAA
jgi:hypothetical protein